MIDRIPLRWLLFVLLFEVVYLLFPFAFPFSLLRYGWWVLWRGYWP